MIEKIKLVNRNIITKTMKTLLFLIPITLITKDLYIFIYGNFNVIFDWNFIINDFLNNTEKWIFSFLTFCSIFLIFYGFEKLLLPILLFNVGALKNKVILNESIEKSKQIIKSRFKENLFDLLDEITPFDLYKEISFFPVCIFLWLIYANQYWSYLVMIFILLITVLFFRILNGVFDEKNKFN